MVDKSRRRFDVAKDVLPWMLVQLSVTVMVTDSKRLLYDCAVANEPPTR